MEWTAETIARLHELHKRYIDSLRRDVIEVNRTLGSSGPAKSKLGYLTRTQFESVLRNSADDPEVVNSWLRRIIRGREHEFPDLQAAG